MTSRPGSGAPTRWQRPGTLDGVKEHAEILAALRLVWFANKDRQTTESRVTVLSVVCQRADNLGPHPALFRPQLQEFTKAVHSPLVPLGIALRGKTAPVMLALALVVFPRHLLHIGQTQTEQHSRRVGRDKVQFKNREPAPPLLLKEAAIALDHPNECGSAGKSARDHECCKHQHFERVQVPGSAFTEHQQGNG
jgi:hypothetical protein